jgi:hypothetical protein
MSATAGPDPFPDASEIAKDCRIDTFRTTTDGGFGVTQETAVRLTHVPTGITVEESADRSVHKNKAVAFEKLRALVEKENMTWAHGRHADSFKVIPWTEVIQRARDHGGREHGNGLAFDTAEQKQQFDIWYAENAATGLRVRTKVKPARVAPEPEKAPKFSTLKELRMWHWREFLRYRRQERLQEERRGYTEHCQSRDIAYLHLAAVQVLNDCLPGTAEQDCAEQDAAGQNK